MKKFSIMRDMNIEKMEQIYYTRDYDKFKMLDDNRVVRISNEIKNSIEEKGILEPITVNEYMQILDGQHRFTVAKRLNILVPFKVASGLKLADILDTKATTRNWSASDYINYYCTNSNKNYLKLKEMGLSESIGTRYLISIYHCGKIEISSIDEKKILREGTLNMHKHKEYGDGVLANYREVIELVNCKTHNMKRAVLRIITKENYEHSKMISQLNKCGATVLFDVKSLKMVQCFTKLQEVYNYRQREKVMFEA
ncbi:MAG: ParB N-terminal domain-containing protein [Cetobacterium sp.]